MVKNIIIWFLKLVGAEARGRLGHLLFIADAEATGYYERLQNE